MVSFITLLILVPASTAMVLPKRDVATILADIKTIDTNVAAVTSATPAYNGGLVNALPISTAEQTLETSVKKATTDAQAQTTPLSSADSTTVLNAASNLTTGISNTLSALAAKKANFQADGLTATVTGDISNLKTETDALADGLIAVASPDTKTAANELKTKIDAQFASASASFAKKR